MAGVTYKCPNCGAYLEFDPESQRWSCPFCDSSFERSELGEDASRGAQTERAQGGTQVAYHCPNCGSEIVTDETTVATHCYYCHSPVVLKGKLTDEHRPDGVLPFTIDREKAVSTFMQWVKDKKYVPKAFFSEAQVENLSGVYYPHYVTECEVEGVLEGEGRNTSVMDSGRYIVTKTDHYRVRREGRMTFRNLIRPALNKANRKLSDGIHPFPLEKVQPFSDAYLSGFVAERRDVGLESVQPDIRQEVEHYVEPLLNESVHYNSFNGQPSAQIRRMDSRYVLLPTWVLTYPNRNNAKEPFYYAMNGCTGEVCGKLPIDHKRLGLTGLAIAGALFVLGCVACYFLL